MKIFLDAGHGGKDGGAQGNGLSEKVLTLDIVKKIQFQLSQYEDVQVKLSRADDKYLSLSERAKLANDWGADLFLSVHINSSADASANGFETFIYNGPVSAKTQAFQNVVHAEIVKQITGVRDRGKKKANYAVIRETHMPALLTENLFISSKTDTARLSKNSFLETVANGHVQGIEKFLGLKRKTTDPPSSETGKIYKIQVGAFGNYDNAKELLEKLEKDGYKPVIKEE